MEAMTRLAAAVVLGEGAQRNMMRWSAVGPVLLAIALLASGCTGDEPGIPEGAASSVGPSGQTLDASIATPDGRTRTYHLYLPASLPTGQEAPLLLALHGGTGSGEQFRRTTGFDRLAEADGFLVVYPDGAGRGPTGQSLRTWNGGYCCGVAAREDVDDVAFLQTLVATVSASYPVDPARVFAVGHSNGGIMAYRLACEMSDVVAAVALQAGSLGIDACAPERPVSLLHIHGTADRNHPIDGGDGSQSISGVSFHAAIDGVRTIAAVDGCPPDGKRAVRIDNPDVRTTTWSPCDDGTEVRFEVVDGATHAWMGHPARASADPPYLGYDSSAETWAFLSAHPRRASE